MADFKIEVLFEIKALDEEKMRNATDDNKYDRNDDCIRIVRYNDGKPMLEKRGFYYSPQHDEIRMGKSKGFNKSDWELISMFTDKIEELL